VSKNVEARIDNCREWGQSKGVVNCSGLTQPRKQDGVLDGAAREARYRCLDRPRALFWRHSSGRAAENHRGQGKAPFVPSLKAAGQGSNAFKSTAA